MGRAGGGRRLVTVDGEAVHTILEGTMASKEDLGLVNVRVRWTMGGSRAENSLWFQPIEGDSQENVTGAALVLFAGYVADRVDQDWRAHRPVTSILTEAIATKYYQSFPPKQGISSVGDAGTSAAGAALPDQCSLVVSLRSAFVGRSYRGRYYLPYIATDGDTLAAGDGELRIDEAVCAALANQWPYNIPMDSGITNRAHQIVIWSPTLGVATPVVSCVVDGNVDTQRRRNS